MVPASPNKHVSIPCTGSSGRSQMAEGWIDHLIPFSDPAGAEGPPHGKKIARFGLVGDEIRSRLVSHVPAHR